MPVQTSLAPTASEFLFGTFRFLYEEYLLGSGSVGRADNGILQPVRQIQQCLFLVTYFSKSASSVRGQTSEYKDHVPEICQVL